MVHVDDAVWVNPKTGEATTGDEGKAYHVSCAPAQHPSAESDDERDVDYDEEDPNRLPKD